MAWPRLPLVLGGAAAGGAAVLLTRWRAAAGRGTSWTPAQPPQLIAHRGGAALAPENTMAAFRQAAHDWAADAIELDVHVSADGECVVIHDPVVDRTTDGVGPVATRTLGQLRELDAGYGFTRDDETFPFRGKGVRIPTLSEVLEALPEMHFIVEVKTTAAQSPFFETVRRAGAADRVIAGAQHDRLRTRFDEYPGPVSASAEQLWRFYLLHRLRLAPLWAPPVDAVQMPEHWRGRRVLTSRLVADLHAHEIPVQIWTVNEPAEMERLLDWGVDGIMTDRPDLLAELLARRFGRPPAPAVAGQSSAGRSTGAGDGARDGHAADEGVEIPPLE